MFRVNENRHSDEHNRSKYIFRVDYLVKGFGHAVEQLTKYSERHSKMFFASPLRIAKELLDLSCEVQRGLEKEVVPKKEKKRLYLCFMKLIYQNPNYPELRELADVLYMKHRDQFNAMGRCANAILDNSHGFYVDGIIKLFDSWKQLSNPNNLQPQTDFDTTIINSAQGHKDFIELFMIRMCEVFSESNRFETMLTVQDWGEEQGSEPDNEDATAMSEIQHNLSGSVDSLAPSEYDDETEEEREYRWVNTGEYEKFEKKWESMNVQGPIWSLAFLG